MHIVTLMATDFLRLRAVEVEPDADGGLVVIRGRNAQGNSSVLKAIQAAIGGKTKETVPIRKGAERAEVVVRLEGEGLTMPYTVRRTFTPAGQRLEITTDEGDRKAAPQKILDAFLGDLTFDPLVFSRLAPGAQREVLMHTAGMDCSGIDAEIDAAREDRMVIGREVRRIEGAAMSAAPPPGRLMLRRWLRRWSRLRRTTLRIVGRKPTLRACGPGNRPLRALWIDAARHWPRPKRRTNVL